MHRTFTKPWMMLGGLVALLLGLLPAVGPVAVLAQNCSPESRPLVVLLNSTTRLQMSTRKPIKTVINPKEGILTIRTVERDPTTVILVGQGPGITRVELEDNDGNREVREILVQADVEYLLSQLRRAVPISNIQVIPNGANAVILTGFVGRAEDVSIAQAVAQSMGFSVISGLRLNGVQQVQLDVVIARVSRNKGRSFGFNFIGTARQSIYGSIPGGVASSLGQALIGVPSPVLQPSGFGQIISTQPGTSTMFGGIIGNAGGFLSFLQALETEGLAKLLAQPRLITLSGNPASFLDGGEQAVPVPAGLGQVGVQFEEFGTRLNFLPIVLGNGRIHLEVEPEVSILDAAAGVAIAGATVPGRATQRVHTTVEMETGQTFVIGGLIQRSHIGSTAKVPVLGQIPFFGALFSQKTTTEVESELVVLVTPHLVDAQSACQVTKVVPGQETRSPDDFELFLEGILEAPRGPRKVFHGNRYVPAHMNGPTADLFPCAGRCDGLGQQTNSSAGVGSVGVTAGGSCATGACGGSGGVVKPTAGQVSPAPLPASMTAPALNTLATSTATAPAEQPVVPNGAPATVTPEGTPAAPPAGEATKAEPVSAPIQVPPPPPPMTGAPAPPEAPGQGKP